MKLKLRHDRVTLIVPPDWMFWAQEIAAQRHMAGARPAPLVEIVVCHPPTVDLETDRFLEAIDRGDDDTPSV